MKQIYSLDSWILFLIIFVPLLLQNTDIGGILLLITFILGTVWFYQLTTDLFAKLSEGHFLSLNKFKFHFFFPLAYFVVITLTMGGYSLNSNNPESYGLLGLFLIALHLISMYCILYCIYFISKTLMCVYNNINDIELSKYIGYILGFWFMPIGIWFIQPKVKEIFGRENPAGE